MKRHSKPILGLSIATILVSLSSNATAVDAAAAQTLARQSGCFTCHAIDKNKVATSWKAIATKLKGDKDAQAKLIKHLTTGPKVKTVDGQEMDHPVIKTKDQDQIKNLVDWILSL